jgi:acetyl esterase/lipase
MKTGIAIFLLLGLSASAVAQLPDTIVIYKTIDTVQLRLHVFYPPGHNADDRHPAIVFFHGGGWVGGAPTQFYKQCGYLASRGMVAITASYRLINTHRTTPKECVKDGKSAIRWIRQHASALGVVPSRLAAGGGSAGGQVAAAAGTIEGFEEEGEDRTVSSKPDALVLFNPVIDNGPEGYGYEKVKEYWRDFSPLHNIDEKTPPAVFFLGTVDRLIPVATGEKFRDLMLQKGRRCDLHLYENQGHGFFNTKMFYETLVEADRFLTSLGYLKGEPTLKKEQQ